MRSCWLWVAWLGYALCGSCTSDGSGTPSADGPIAITSHAARARHDWVGTGAGTAPGAGAGAGAGIDETAIVPTRAARAWTTALAPNARGGWNFITQTYEYQSGSPTEWVVLDLGSRKQTVTEGPAAVYANSLYQIAEQLQASNGRIFFPELDDQMAYYDPVDETVKQVGKLPGDAGDALVYRVVFGPDGMLYGGTQSSGLPTVFRLDPNTLQYQVLGKVGQDRSSYSYAYYLAVDPPWLYAAVGETPWELAALNMTTGEMRILATRADDGFMQFDTRPEGITVTMISGLRTPEQTYEIQWCADGALYPFVPGAAPPFPSRSVAPQASAVTRAPEVDVSRLDPGGDNTGYLRWRADAASPWRDASFRVAYTSPVDIESLAALPDGTLLGGAAQYHGFFRYDPVDRTIRRFSSLGISGGPRTWSAGLLYMAGYPNGVLYAYDPDQPWSATMAPQPDANASYLGNFAAAGAHYAYFLEPSVNGRMYYSGRRERDGVGGGVGYYDPQARRFAGHHIDLGTLDPQGLAVLDDQKLVVYSGRSNTGDTAQLVVFDAELGEQGRQTVAADLHDTGELFTTAASGVVVGVSALDRVIYRHDVATGTLLASQPLPGAVVASTQRPSDRSIWIVLDAALWRYDATTLDAVRVRDLPDPPAAGCLLRWQGDRLFWANGSELRQLATPGY